MCSFLRPTLTGSYISGGAMMYLDNNCLFMQPHIIEWGLMIQTNGFLHDTTLHSFFIRIIIVILKARKATKKEKWQEFNGNVDTKSVPYVDLWLEDWYLQFWIWQIFRVIEFPSTQNFENLDEGTGGVEGWWRVEANSKLSSHNELATMWWKAKRLENICWTLTFR